MLRVIGTSLIAVITATFAYDVSAQTAPQVATHRLMIASDQRGGLEIWTLEADGSDPVVLTDHTAVPRDEYGPSPSPDGRSFVITTYRFGGWKLGLVDENGVRRLTDPNRHNGRLYEGFSAWSPDGRFVAFLQYHHQPGLQVFDIVNRNSRRLVPEKHPYQLLFPSWSATGDSVVYSNNADGDYELYMVKVSGGAPERLTDNDYDDLAASISPDGQQIALFTNETGLHQLYVTELDALGHGEKKVLTASPSHVRHYDVENDAGWYISTPAWSLNGEWIAHGANYDGNIDVYLTSHDGAMRHRITDNPGLDVDPAWIKR